MYTSIWQGFRGCMGEDNYLQFPLKTYSITGWRLGYLIGPEEVIEGAKKSTIS